jgi:hypothetical protein
MIRYHSQKKLSLTEFNWPFQTALDENNRWVKLSECIPWDELAEGYYQDLADTHGRGHWFNPSIAHQIHFLLQSVTNANKKA